MFTVYPRRTILGFSLFIGQAFLYNAITFGYAQILATFFHVTTNPGYYFAVIAVGNLLGPLLLSRLFDSFGRKPMIAGTYVISGLLLLLTAYLFDQGMLTATTMTACWCVVLFFASAGASSAYLTVSEVFPMETRAMAIAFFYAIGTAAGGISGPLLFSSLVSTGKASDTAVAFCVGAALMILGGHRRDLPGREGRAAQPGRHRPAAHRGRRRILPPAHGPGAHRVTAAPRTHSVTAGPRALQLIRAGYGAALILLPGQAIQLATGRAPRPPGVPGGAGARRPAPGPGRADRCRASARDVRGGRRD